METVFRLKVSELNTDFIKSAKSLFKKDREIEIIVHSSTDFGLNQPESNKEYMKRLNRAIENVEKGNNTTSFTMKELEDFAKDRIE